MFLQSQQLLISVKKDAKRDKNGFMEEANTLILYVGQRESFSSKPKSIIINAVKKFKIQLSFTQHFFRRRI